MKRHYLYLSLACFALCLLLIVAWWMLIPRAPQGQVGYIPPAPPSAAPIAPSPTPTRTSVWTPTPTAQPSFTPTATATPSSTATAHFVSPTPTPTLGPDADTRGDPPTSLPKSGGAPANVSLLAQFLLGLASGGLTFKAAEFIFAEMAAQGVRLDKRRKRLAAYGISFTLAIGALGLAALLGYVEWNGENIFGAGLAAFATSQALHGALGIQPETEPIAPFVWGK